MELFSGVLLSLLLEVEGLLVVGQLSLGVLSGGGEGFSLGGDFDDEGFEVELGLGFGLSGIDEGLGEGLVDFTELSDDVVELFSGEGGGDLHKGEDGVGGTDLVELGQGGEDFLIGLDGSELLDDDFDGINDTFGFDFESLEGFSIVGSLFSEFSLLLVEDVELDDLVLDFSLEFSDLLAEGLDFL